MARELQARLASQVERATLDLTALLVPPDQRDSQDQPETVDSLASRVRQARLVLRATLDQPVLRVPRVILERLVQRADAVIQAERELQDLGD